jgi:hypothetical protein
VRYVERGVKESVNGMVSPRRKIRRGRERLKRCDPLSRVIIG